MPEGMYIPPPINEEEWEIDGSEEIHQMPGSIYAPPVNEEEWEIDYPANDEIEEPEKPIE